MVRKTAVLLLGLILSTLFTPVTASALLMPPGNGGSSSSYKYYSPSNFDNSYRNSRCSLVGWIDGVDAGNRLYLTTRYGITLRYGSTGGCVQDIQHYLNAVFCTSSTRLVEDGAYGGRTRTAVTRLQQAARNRGLKQSTSSYGNTADISVDGVYGKQSYLAMMYMDVLYTYSSSFGISYLRSSCL